MSPYLSVSDLLIPPLLLLVFFLHSLYVRNRNRNNPAYKYYFPGLIVKMIGSISICLVYTLYYSSGDSTGYFEQGRAIFNLLFKNPSYFFEVVFNGPTAQNYSYFDENTTYVCYSVWVSDYSAMFISRLVAPLYLFTFDSFIGISMILCWICYGGIWKLFILFSEQFPEIRKELAISILFVPSVVFWGSGLLKDTITLSCIGWYAYGFYWLVIKNKYRFSTVSAVLISGFLLIALKPYILVALLPGSLIWFSYDKISKAKSKAVRVIIAPILIVLGIGGGFYSLSSLGSVLGEYSLGTVLDRAVVVQQDLKRSYYGGNSFDIGDFDASVKGVASKAHLAINATLFRPYLWEVKNPLMLLSALESTYIMILTAALLFRLRFWGFFRLIGENPLLLFAILFSLFFAFSVGLSTPNFGALSRLKIPCIPFFVASLFVLKHLYMKKTKKKFRF